MTIETQIKYYLEQEGTYSDGVTLLKRTGTNVSFFEKYLTAFYVPDNVESSLIAALKSNLKEEKNTKEKVSFLQKEEPIQIAELREVAKKLHKKHTVLHEQMRNAKTDLKRYDFAKEIIQSVIPALDDIYDTIRKYEREGIVPTDYKKETVVQETVEKMQKITSLRSRISRLKSWIKNEKLEAELLQKYKIEILEKEVQLKLIESELKI